ncbi:PREDICTED: probable 2-oxoglutarate-dependent dioxygenase AOP1.2, partial [Tarenaya hassleriana]
MGSNETRGHPIINFSDKNMKPGTEIWRWTRERVRDAMERHGWFVADWDNFPVDLHRGIISAAEELLALPSEVKIQNGNHKARHGYVTMLADDQPVHEGLGIDLVTDFEQCRKFAGLMWPDHGNDRFCETVHAYARMQAELEQMVVRMLFESYGLDRYSDK